MELCQLTGPFDNDLISVLPESVRFICSNGAGYDAVDITACNERSLCISIPSYLAGRLLTEDQASVSPTPLVKSAVRQPT